jgi:hypothetical protein
LSGLLFESLVLALGLIQAQAVLSRDEFVSRSSRTPRRVDVEFKGVIPNNNLFVTLKGLDGSREMLVSDGAERANDITPHIDRER